MKKKIIALLTAVFALVTGLFVLTGCSNTPQNGFDIELAKAFAEETGIELRLLEIKWENKMTEINSGNIDLIWNGMTIQPEMENNLEISNPYMTNSQVMLVRADSDLTYEKIMADKDIRITAEGDSAGAAWIADNGFEPIYGARPLKRFIQKHVETMVARAILEGRVKDGSQIVIDERNDELIIQSA